MRVHISMFNNVHYIIFRWAFLEKLCENNFLSKLVAVIMSPEENCNINTPSVKVDQHSAVATQVMSSL